MKKVSRTIFVSSVLVLGFFFSSEAQTSADPPNPPNATQGAAYPDNSNHNNWGWLGLIGLVGLAGLVKPKPVDKRVEFKNTSR